MASWDYSWNGSYFLTICSYKRKCIFGTVNQGVVEFSPIGEIIKEEWDKSFVIRKELSCKISIIMPNHLHAIVEIQNSNKETQNHVSTRIESNFKKGVAYRPPKSISSFVAGFKSSATKRINSYRNSPKRPVWQPRFHDHIIRSEEDYQRIYDYIKYNPLKWQDDTYHQ